MNNTMILGIGGTGGVITDIVRKETTHPELALAQYVFVDSDEKDLNKHSDGRCKIIRLESDCDSINKDIFKGIKQLVVIVALGGYTGSKYSLIAINEAKQAGVEHIIVIGICPFLFEGMTIILRAIQTGRSLSIDSGIIVEICNLQRYYEKYKDVEIEEALNLINHDILSRIEQFVMTTGNETSVWCGFNIHGNSLELDYILESPTTSNNDVFNVLSKNGQNWIVSRAGNNFGDTFNDAVSGLPHCLNKIERVLIFISCNNRPLSLSELHEACLSFSKELKDKIQVKWRFSHKFIGNDYKVVIITSSDY